MESSNEVVNEELTPSVGEDVKAQEQQPEATEEASKTAQAGDKTDPNLLLKALQEERERRREAEAQLEKQVKSSAPSEEEVYTDEGKALKLEIASLKEKIDQIEQDKQLEQVYGQHPELRALKVEFDSYRADYPRHKLENVAKLFLTEKGLLEVPRKGLEKTTGGPRTPMTSGMTAEDVAKLRTTNFKKYQEMLMKGQIQIK